MLEINVDQNKHIGFTLPARFLPRHWLPKLNFQTSIRRKQSAWSSRSHLSMSTENSIFQCKRPQLPLQWNQEPVFYPLILLVYKRIKRS